MKLLYKVLSFMNSILILTATDLMIKGLRVDTTYDTATMSWVKPEFLPQYYMRIVQCMPLCENRVYYFTAVSLLSYETQHIISNILPGSRCEINLAARYNPASLDPGLASTVYTKEKGDDIYFFYFTNSNGGRLSLISIS